MPVGGELLVFSFSDKLESFPDGWPCGRKKDKEHKAELLKCYSCSRNCFSYIFISSVIIYQAKLFSICELCHFDVIVFCSCSLHYLAFMY